MSQNNNKNLDSSVNKTYVGILDLSGLSNIVANASPNISGFEDDFPINFQLNGLDMSSISPYRNALFSFDKEFINHKDGVFVSTEGSVVCDNLGYDK